MKNYHRKEIDKRIADIEAALGEDIHSAYIQEYANGKLGIILDGTQIALVSSWQEAETAFNCICNGVLIVRNIQPVTF